MKPEHKEIIRQLVDTLSRAAQKIRILEAEAHRALFAADNPAAYKENLEEKTALLMELADLAEPYLAGMEPGLAAAIERDLIDFAIRAGQARALSSTFYMAALLYSENYQEGDKNDLEKYIDRLRVEWLQIQS